MKLRGSFLSLLLLICPALAISQSEPVPRVPRSVLVKAGRLLDVRKGTYIENAGIWIEGERIKEVGGFSDVQSHAPKVKVIDLGRATVLPGLIDCHTHLMARIADTDDGYTLTLATKSQAFRALEGAFDARLTLNAGFTSVRDVESEGSRIRRRCASRRNQPGTCGRSAHAGGDPRDCGGWSIRTLWHIAGSS